MIARTYDELKGACERRDYRFFTGELNLNYIWERNDLIYSNHFTDTLHIAYQEGGENKVLSIPATTTPGTKGAAFDPPTVEGVKGIAVIQPGQYPGAWSFVDSYDGFTKYPYFLQVSPINYWRDPDGDSILTEVQAQMHKIYGTCWHRMSQKGAGEDSEVNNWSKGCMGAIMKYWDQVIELTRKAVSIYGPRFTGTLIEKGDF